MTINNIKMDSILPKLRSNLKKNMHSNLVLSSSFKYKQDKQKKILTGKYTKAAVICLFDFTSTEFNTILTLRSKNLKDHPGQISFPGGKVNKSENFTACAIRETSEEIGIKKKNINIIGEMNMYLSGSNFLIRPIIGLTKGDYKISLNKKEVDKIINFPISYLFESKNRTKSNYIDKYDKKKKFYYDINWNQYRIWGTTAIILVHLSKIIYEVTVKNV